MTSFLSKLKDLVNANVRGARRYKTASQPADETTGKDQPVAEVTEAPVRRHKVPEVTEAPPARVKPASQPTATQHEPATRIEEAQKEQAEDLQEGRVADFLRGEQSKET